MYRAPSVRLQENESELFFANIHKLTEGEAECCEGRITQLEIQTALSSKKNGTSPGPNGFTVEFFKFFWNELKDIVTEAFQEIQRTGVTKTSFKKSVTILIPKRGKDQRFVENLRPISLLDVLYKIFTKVIAKGSATGGDGGDMSHPTKMLGGI